MRSVAGRALMISPLAAVSSASVAALRHVKVRRLDLLVAMTFFMVTRASVVTTGREGAVGAAA